MEAFQSPLTPEELALTLSVMSFLWCNDPPECEPDECQSPSANLQSLTQLLSRPDTIGENKDLVFDLHRSFHCAARRLDEETLAPITDFLTDSQNFDGESPRSEELLVYFMKRLDGKGHVDAIPTQSSGL